MVRQITNHSQSLMHLLRIYPHEILTQSLNQSLSLSLWLKLRSRRLTDRQSAGLETVGGKSKTPRASTRFAPATSTRLVLAA